MNIQANKLYDSVVSYHMAVSDFVGFNTFNSSGFFAGKAENTYECMTAPSHVSGCVVTTIDHFAASGEPSTHLKIDVDGVERLVLSGAANTLLSGSLQHILVETYEESAVGISSYLANFGFTEKSHFFPSEFRYNNEGRQGNYIFSK